MHKFSNIVIIYGGREGLNFTVEQIIVYVRI